MPKGKGKTKSGRTKVKGGALSKVKEKAKGILGKGKKGVTKKRRSKGPAYWANKVLVEKLKKRYFKIKYGGVR